MKIKAYVKDGYLALECGGVFDEPLRKVVLNSQERCFLMVFDWSGEEVTLDCPMDDEFMAALKPNDKCGVGFFFGQKMVGAQFVPFEIRN